MKLTRAVTLLTLTGISLTAFGQDSGWEGEAELGVLITTGNSEETNIKGRVGLLHNTERWRNIMEVRSAYSEAEDETTAERYRGEAETNLKFSGLWSPGLGYGGAVLPRPVGGCRLSL